jgi:hypothetical protein
MTLRSKRAFISKILSHWTREFRISADINVNIYQKVDQALEYQVNPPYLNLEETVVTTLERAYLGADKWEKLQVAYPPPDKGTIASMDTNSGEYQHFTLSLYPALMDIKDEKDFKTVCEAIIIHELLHIVIFPLSKYAESLEGRR